ncbi:MAG: hypothetical protein IKI04_01175 [Bacilli bacterium]|nr:hypothetical protein [Bacilli bacterium]
MDNEVRVTNIKSLVIAITLVVLIVTAGTFAWLSYRSKSTAMVLTIGDINDIQITLKPYQLDLELSPVLTYTSLDANEEYVTVSVVNNSSSKQHFSLFYDIHEIDSSLVSNDFKYTVLKSTDNWSTSNVDTSGNFLNANTTDPLYVLEAVAIPANTTWNYRVYTWVDGTNNPNISNAEFRADLNAKIIDSTPLPSFITSNAVIDNIASTYVTNANGVQFNAISSDTNGKGIYIRSGTENDAHPIYYYRGAVTDNNVLFGGFCWKIVRTTETGGIKLIYNGVPSNGECNNTGESSQLASTVEFNTNNDSPADVGYMYGTRYTYSSGTGTGWYYAPDVTYNNGTYTLTSKTISGTTYNVETKSTINSTNLNYHHYTCGSSTDTTCTSVRYVYYVSSTTAYYITLTNGKKVEDALSEMLTNSSNENSSTIKTSIDTWYQTNMTSYTSMLEDTSFCNDRTIGTLNGWDPNGGSTTAYLYFSPYNRAYTTYTPSLTCSKNDSFTVTESSTGNGKLTYPVGLLTSDEAMLAGGKGETGNSTYYLYTGQYYCLGSAGYWLGSYAREFAVFSSGNLNNGLVHGAGGGRPVVSLKPGTQFSGGTGTVSNPYIVS